MQLCVRIKNMYVSGNAIIIHTLILKMKYRNAAMINSRQDTMSHLLCMLCVGDGVYREFIHFWWNRCKRTNVLIFKSLIQA